MSGAVPAAVVMEAPVAAAAPVTTTYTTAAPAVTTTYAAPPVAAGPPAPPQPLTTGMPDPATIAKQKAAYAKMLDDRLKQGKDVLDQQQKQTFLMQLEQQVKSTEFSLQQQYSEQQVKST